MSKRQMNGLLFVLTFFVASCATSPKSVYQSGLASWYGKKFQGRRTASGEIFDMAEFTAAHRRLKFGTRVRVESRSTGRSVVVRINDRGPFAKGRIIDLSKAAANELGILRKGFAEVNLYILN